MTNKEKQEWLEVKYPLTIIADRYDGTYSGGGWLAFPLDYDEIPTAVNGDDPICAAFWKAYYGPVGRGNSAQSALDGLIKQMCEFEPEESEDERIIKTLQEYVKNRNWMLNGPTQDEVLSWLEKQKELNKMIVVSPEVWDNAINEAFENGKKEGGKQKEQKPILEVFGFKVGDAVRLKDGDGRKHIIKSFEEIEGVHGPNFYHVEFEDNSARDGIYPGEEYPNGYYTQMEKFEEEQKPSWSEEDEKMKERLITRLNWITYNTRTDGTSPNITFFDEIEWLKSLRPSWKPSEEQMEALNALNCHGGLSYIGQQNLLISLYNDLKKLK